MCHLCVKEGSFAFDIEMYTFFSYFYHNFISLMSRGLVNRLKSKLIFVTSSKRRGASLYQEVRCTGLRYTRVRYSGGFVIRQIQFTEVLCINGHLIGVIILRFALSRL